MSYLEPALPLLLLFGLLGLIRNWRARQGPRKPLLLTVAMAGLLLLSSKPAAWLIAQPLQGWYEPVPMPRDTADAIVVLSGSFDKASSARPYPLLGEDTYERLKHAAWLFKYWFPRPILECGVPEEVVREFLESEGVPAASVWVETRSTSTRENAFNCHKILRQHGISRIALVVNANSMLRASASFKKLGIEVVPAPSRFDVPGVGLNAILPSWNAIRLNGETLHEAVGLFWYWLRGWI